MILDYFTGVTFAAKSWYDWKASLVEAFHLAGVEDPTPYDDPHYWREACRAYLAKHLA